MKKILSVLFTLVYLCVNSACAMLIEGNVSMTDKVPVELYGSWKVESTCTRTTNRDLFESGSVDIWTLTRNGDMITLSNPLSGARADINVNDVKGKTVKFIKKSSYPNEESVETPVLTLQGDNFTGVDRINIKTFANGKLIREDYVEYKVTGTKISGASARGILGI